MKILLGERIKIARGQIEQSDFARQLNVSTNKVSRWETNKNTPSFNEVVGIAKITSRSLDWFAGLEPDDDMQLKMDLMSDLVQWAGRHETVKIKAIIELLKK